MMALPLLIFVFVAMLVMCFAVIAVMLRPRPEQAALSGRMDALVSRHSPGASVARDLALLRPSTQTGAFHRLDSLLAGTGFIATLQLLTLQAKVSSSVSTVFLSCGAVGVAASALAMLLTSNAWLALIVGAVFAYVPILRLQMRRKRRVAAFDAVLPDAIELCARSLRAGHSMVAAIGNVAEQGLEPVKSEFAEVFRMQNYGLPVRDAFTQLMERMPSADLRVVVTGILVQKDTGGNLAEIMDHITDVIRDRVRIKGDIQVHTAQGRLTGWILCLLPVILLVVINLMSPGYSTLLFHDPLGQKLLYGSVALLILGGVIIRHIVTGIEV